MAFTASLTLGSIVTALSTELNSLAGGAWCSLGSAIDNTYGAGGTGGFLLCDIELVYGTLGGTPAANTGLEIYFVQSQDGTNYERNNPVKSPACVFSFNAASAADREIKQAILPPGKWKPVARNSSAVAMSASGNTVKIRPVTIQQQ